MLACFYGQNRKAEKAGGYYGVAWIKRISPGLPFLFV